MPGDNRTLCTNSNGKPDEIRIGFGERFAHCPTCGRIGKPRKDGTLREHSVPGPNTASLDRTYSNLFAGGVPVAETGTPYIPIDFEEEVTTCKSCGNPAPKRDFFVGGGTDECSPCFIGRTANQLVTRRETETLIAELQKMIAD